MERMMKNREINPEEVLEANRIVHSSLAITGEYEKSPHFLPENKERVSNVLAELRKSLPSKTEANLLDLGCGTGFILQIEPIQTSINITSRNYSDSCVLILK